MKLVEVQVVKFKNILDSSPVKVQPDVTALVGKNESGKSAFLQALYRLNPARPNARFNILDHYPAWREKQDRRTTKLEDVRPVRAVFELEPRDTQRSEKLLGLGSGVVRTGKVTVERDYSNKLHWRFDLDEKPLLATIIRTSLPRPVEEQAKKCTTVEELRGLVTELKASSGDDAKSNHDAATSIEQGLIKTLGTESLRQVIERELTALLPKFFYFSEYSSLPSSVKVKELFDADAKTLTDDRATALALLKMAATEKDYVLNADYERRKRELENVANALTGDVLEWWTQNRELRVLIDVTQVTQQNPHGGHTSVIDELKLRIWDDRHALSLAFAERSTGFRWFFSFLAAFSPYESGAESVIILLDEPATGLHARAQRDFLKFIDVRLGAKDEHGLAKNQVLYTTHSPFLVQPTHLERVRIVEDKGRDAGSTVTDDILSTGPDTLFPLQGALGYDFAQHLFVAPHNLVVEGTSDFTYLAILSDHLKALKREGLDEKWSVVPVGGADLIPTFVALLGNHLNVTVLVDGKKTSHQKLTQLAEKGYLSDKRIIAIAEFLGHSAGDIEDLFTADEYLALYNRAFGKNWKPSDLQGQDRIVARLARKEGIEKFDHGRPADVFLRDKVNVLAALGADTLDRFERLFKQANATLPK